MLYKRIFGAVLIAALTLVVVPRNHTLLPALVKGDTETIDTTPESEVQLSDLVEEANSVSTEVVPEETQQPAEQTQATETTTDEVVAPTDESAADQSAPDTTQSEDVQQPTEESVDQSVLTTETTEEVAPVSTPELSTDKEDYHPGDTVTIFGKLFESLKAFTVKIFGSDLHDANYTESQQEVTADENGNFSTSFSLDTVFRPFYEMIASSLDGSPLAQGIFRDSAIGTYDQCSNDDGDGYASGDTGCRWTSGNIQANNSTYFEGDSTVQRLWLEGYVPGSSHTVTFKYGTTKSGKHAYDYLTTWNKSENWLTVADRCQDIVGCSTANETTLAMQDDPNVDNSIEPSGASRLFTMRGGTISTVSAPAIVSGDYSSDSETAVTVSFTVGSSSGSMCTTKKVQGQDVTSCGVALWFGAHVANSSEWNTFNNTTGAGSITGSPYHVALDQEDSASVGQRDNQMQSAAILPSASITIIKDAVPNDAQDFSFTTTGGLTPSSFSLDDDANNTLSNTQTFTGLSAGTYTVTESATSGWNLTNLACTDPTSNTTTNGSTVTINLASGEAVTCTYTNTLQQGTLLVKKVVINDNGGTQTAGAFSFQVNGGSATSFNETADADSNPLTGQNSISVNVGTYSVTEPAVTGYATTYNNCSNVSVAAGQTTTCTITNNDIAPTLTLVKTVVNDNDGTATTADFQGKIDGNNVAWGTATTVSAGGHTASETNIAGYTAGSWGGDCAANGSVTLALGDAKTCTITNDDQPGTLIVKKVLIKDNGGTAAVNDFSFKVNNGSNVLFEADAQNDMTVNAGTYSVVENAAAGYTTTYDNCSNVVIPNGGSATCTITNNDQPAHLTLVKTVINDNGGVTPAGAWTLNATGPTNISGATTTASVTNASVNAGTYTLGESTVSGYSRTSLSCVINSGASANAVNSQVTLALGDNAVCTFVNDDIAPSLTLVKVVTNDNGGSADPSDFTLTATGPTGFSGAGPTVNNGASFDAGTYALSETNLSGYNASAWSCTGTGTQNGSNITLALGQSATCTITNDDQQAYITVTKVVHNTHGGTAAPNDFNLTLEGNAVISGVAVPVNPGTYTAAETLLSGYAFDGFSGACDSNGDVTVALGESKNCTLTNSDIQPKLTVTKVVINHGGTKQASDFPLFVDTTNVASGVQNGFNAGNYTVSETGSSDYTETISGDCASNGSVTLAVGDTKSCTITNEEKTAKLTIVKNADPNDLIDFSFNGGQVLGSFLLDDDQGVADIGLNGDVNRDQSKTFTNLDTGSYTVTETEPNQFWTLQNASCVNTADQTAHSSSLTGTALTVILTPGSDVTCTFLNHKDSPTRTQGFWQTHTAFTSAKFSSLFAGGMQIGVAPSKGSITNIQSTGQSQLFGAYFSNIAQKTTGKGKAAQRTDLEKARIQLLQQLVTAKLNCAAFTCSSTIAAQIINADAAYAATNVSAILAAAAQMDAYNNSGDTLVVGSTGSATPQLSKQYADLTFWNQP